jgi:ribonuclease BN (tRNA processing enzyme)
VGWGHSTWQEAVKVAKAANVDQLVIFHHDPLHTDAFLDEMGRQAAAAFPHALIAMEGMTIQLTPRRPEQPTIRPEVTVLA